MKTRKLFLMCALAMMAGTTTYAQNAVELAKQQAELNEIHKKLLNAKPTKTAKKEAKKLEKEGWTVPAGSKSIEQQITESQLYREERMANEDGNSVPRFIVQTGMATSGSFNAGVAAARMNAMVELAASIKTQLFASIEHNIKTGEQSTLTSATFEKFQQHAEAMVDETLTNTVPVLTIYRRLPNGGMEVQVSVAFDKKEILSNMRKALQKELGQEAGDEVFSVAKKTVEKDF